MTSVRHRVRAGVSAQRRHDGSVDVEFWDKGGPGPTHVEHFSPTEWVDLVAAVSAGGGDPHPENQVLLKGTLARMHMATRPPSEPGE